MSVFPVPTLCPWAYLLDTSHDQVPRPLIEATGCYSGSLNECFSSHAFVSTLEFSRDFLSGCLSLCWSDCGWFCCAPVHSHIWCALPSPPTAGPAPLSSSSHLLPSHVFAFSCHSLQTIAQVLCRQPFLPLRAFSTWPAISPQVTWLCLFHWQSNKDKVKQMLDYYQM